MRRKHRGYPPEGCRTSTALSPDPDTCWIDELPILLSIVLSLALGVLGPAIFA